MARVKKNHLLYLAIHEERHEEGVVRYVTGDRCAVFDEQQLHELILKKLSEAQDLKRLRDMAIKHSYTVSDTWLQDLTQEGVEFTIKKYVRKEC